MNAHRIGWGRLIIGVATLAVLFLVVFVLLRIPARRVEIRPRAPILVAVSFDRLPGWRQTDPRAALPAFRKSCDVLMKKPPATSVGGMGYAGTVKDWRGVCSNLPTGAPGAASAGRFFENNFQPLEVVLAGGASALFTGYYEPELTARRTRGGQFQVPIYGLPDNLVSVDLGSFRPEWGGQHLYGCLAKSMEWHLLPCPARAQIDDRGLPNAQVLFYVDDPIAVFFLHIQGSGRIRLEDGTVVRAAYAAQNGRPYRAIGRTLIAHGWLNRTHMSMQSIRAWMRGHPAQARAAMENDPSYVFFKEKPLDDPEQGAVGSEGVPLTPGASLAVDGRIHPLGIPVYVAAKRPDADPARPDHVFDQLLIAQDTGGAIRGAARGDVYWGWGAQAESIAGRMKATGRFFVLVPKAVAVRLRNRREPPTS